MDLISSVTSIASGSHGAGNIAATSLQAGQDIAGLADKDDKHHVRKSLGLAETLVGGILGGGR